MTTITTWAATAAAIPQRYADAAEALRRVTADIRHDWRRDSVIEAAREAVRDAKVLFGSAPRQREGAIEAAAALLIRTELLGAGGPKGVGYWHTPAGWGTPAIRKGNRATTRMWWAQGLGSGRAHAMDGAAWDAALEAAYCHLRGGRPAYSDAAVRGAEATCIVPTYHDYVGEGRVREETTYLARWVIYHRDPEEEPRVAMHLDDGENALGILGFPLDPMWSTAIAGRMARHHYMEGDNSAAARWARMWDAPRLDQQAEDVAA